MNAKGLEKKSNFELLEYVVFTIHGGYPFSVQQSHFF